jgi:hypothetical protein
MPTISITVDEEVGYFSKTIAQPRLHGSASGGNRGEH